MSEVVGDLLTEDLLTANLSRLSRGCVDSIAEGMKVCEANGWKTTVELTATGPVAMAVWRAFELGRTHAGNEAEIKP